MPSGGKIRKQKKYLDGTCERYRVMYESSSDAIMTLEPPEWKFASGNPAAMKMFGVKNEKEFISLNLGDLSPEIQPNGKKSQSEAKRIIQKAMKEGSAFFEWTHRKYRGKIFFATVLLNRFKFNGRNILEAIVRDVSSQKEVEIRFSELFKNIKSGVAVYETRNNGQNFFFKDFNRAAEKLDRIKKAEIIGKNVKEIFPGIEGMGLLNVFKRVYKTGKSEEFPVKLYQDDRISGWRNNFIYKLPTGEIVAIYEDVTSQKKVEEKIRLNEEKFKEIFDYSPIAIELYSTKGRLEKVNKATLEIFGIKSEKEIQGFSLFDDPNITNDIKEKLKRGELVKYENVFDFEKVRKFNLYNTIKKGIIYLNITIVPIKKGSDGYLVMINDVTHDKDSQIILQEKFKEIEKVNKLMIGRELKMIELKDKLSKLEKK